MTCRAHELPRTLENKVREQREAAKSLRQSLPLCGCRAKTDKARLLALRYACWGRKAESRGREGAGNVCFSIVSLRHHYTCVAEVVHIEALDYGYQPPPPTRKELEEELAKCKEELAQVIKSLGCCSPGVMTVCLIMALCAARILRRLVLTKSDWT